MPDTSPRHRPDTRLLHRSLTFDYPVIAGGTGVYLIDTDGKRYLDASGGAAVSCLGHGESRVTEAIARQLERIAFAHSSFFTNAPAEQLAAFLCDRGPGAIGRVCFVSGGSEAIETALKLARQVHVEQGEADRSHIIARRQSYHGATLGTLSVGGHAARRAIYETMLLSTVSHIEPCYPYRHQRAGETGEDYGLRAARALEAEIERVGPANVAAFVAETVAGSTIGCVPPAPGYFREIRRICDAHGVLLVLDEVMCGMGRTGTLFACEQDGIEPDLVAVAKGLGGGYQPIGAVLVRAGLAEAIAAGSGALEHGHTYMAHAAACAGALAVQQVIEEDNLLERVRTRGDRFQQLLRDRFEAHEHIGEIRGRGLFVGLELVEDRADKRPFPAERKLAARLKAAAQRNGLICYPAGGTADGANGDHVLLAPPFIVSEDELAEIVSLLDQSISEVLES